MELVGDADGDLVEVVEDVELGEGDGVDAVQELGVAGGDRVEPAAAARAAGDGAELVAAAAQELAGRVGQLARERAAADPRGVGLEHADGAVDPRRRHAGAGAGAAGGRVGAGDVGIGAVVDVQQRPLGAFEQEALAFA